MQVCTPVKPSRNGAKQDSYKLLSGNVSDVWDAGKASELVDRGLHIANQLDKQGCEMLLRISAVCQKNRILDSKWS